MNIQRLPILLINSTAILLTNHDNKSLDVEEIIKNKIEELSLFEMVTNAAPHITFSYSLEELNFTSNFHDQIVNYITNL